MLADSIELGRRESLLSTFALLGIGNPAVLLTQQAVNIDGVLVIGNVDPTPDHERRNKLHERTQAVPFGPLLTIPYFP